MERKWETDVTARLNATYRPRRAIGRLSMTADGPKKRIAFIVAPNGASGGGMGRVKDYIVQAPAETWGDIEPRGLVTRDGGGRLHSLRLVVRALASIRDAKRKGELAFVHVNMGDRLSLVRKSLVVWQCHRSKVPVFVHLHAVEHGQLKGWMLRLLAMSFRRATAAILLGEVYERWLRETLKVTTPCEILWNGVPIDPVTGRRHNAPTAGEPLRIVFLGSLGERKGVADLIGALALLPDDAPPWRATLAGPGDIPHYLKLAADAGINEQVDFPGWQEQPQARALLSAADVLVLPSYDEGLPLVILEALALGTPVIATPVGAIPEVLTDEADILLVTPGDRQDIARQILRILNVSALRQSLCDTGLETFAREFRMEAYCGKLLAIWRRYAEV
jgi:glycosyltransferase involved in cell wall biosynthesis